MRPDLNLYPMRPFTVSRLTRLLRFVWVLAVYGLVYTHQVSAQTVEEYSAVMTRIGCGAEFSKAMALPVPMRGYSDQAEQRIGVTSEMRTTARGVVVVDLRNEDTIRRRLLLNPINSVDRMTQAQAKDALADYLFASNSNNAGDAANFERGVAAVMLCVLEKRKGLKPEPATVEGKLEKLNDPECGGHIAQLLSMYKPPPYPTHDLIVKNIIEGQSGSNSSMNLPNLRSTGFDITTVVAPNTFRGAFSMLVRSEEYLSQFLADMKQTQRLVPSKEEKDRASVLEHNHRAYQTLSLYWTCRRASQEGVFSWLDQSPERFIFWTTMGPSTDSLELDQQTLRLFRVRIWSKEGTLHWNSELLHTCFNLPLDLKKSEQRYQQESGLPLCNRLNSSELSPEMSNYRNTIVRADRANLAIHIRRENILAGRSKF
jgi:hypothetical protein